MRRGSWVIACLVGVLAFAGCGKESHPNDPRPAIASEVTVAISTSDVSVQPSSVGEPGSGQAISQNEGETGPAISDDVPVIATFTIANLTGQNTKLRIEGPKNFTSNPIIANGTGEFKLALPTGSYSVSSTAGSGRADTFRVGTARSSSSSDLLLP